jgi:hypothetical protein
MISVFRFYPFTARTKQGNIPLSVVHFTDVTKNIAFNFVTCNHFADWDENDDPILRIQTLAGTAVARFGDYIVKGIFGDFFVITEEQFQEMFGEVE